MKYWSKSALSIYRYLETMSNSIDKVVLDTGKSSYSRDVAKFQTTNYQTSSSKPGVVTFYKTADNTDGIGIATFSSAYSVRANVGMKNNAILSVSGNSFTFAAESSMWGAMAAARWRWFAWG